VRGDDPEEREVEQLVARGLRFGAQPVGRVLKLVALGLRGRGAVGEPRLACFACAFADKLGVELDPGGFELAPQAPGLGPSLVAQRRRRVALGAGFALGAPPVSAPSFPTTRTCAMAQRSISSTSSARG
jgi:hypothetical protein